MYEITANEDAVTLQVRIEGRKVRAILDTGATPCVIDKGTVERLKLGRRIEYEPSKVFGLCNSPVRVLGYIKAEIEVGSCKPLVQRLQVLDSEEPTVLLGRQLMQRLGTVSFDFNQGRVKIGDVWETYEATVHGATPLARAQVVRQRDRV